MNKIKTLIKRQKTKPRKSFEAGECDNMKSSPKGPGGSRAGIRTSRREEGTGVALEEQREGRPRKDAAD